MLASLAPALALMVAQAAGCAGVPVDVMEGIVMAESHGNPLAVSAGGDLGLAQVNPGFHPEILEGPGWQDPYYNVRVGAGVLAECMSITGGDVPAAVACYNGGPRAGLRWLRGIRSRRSITYVERVMGRWVTR